MRPGDTVLYSWRIEDNTEDVFDPGLEDRFYADINDEYGKSRIVSTLRDVLDPGELVWKFADDADFEDIGQTKEVDEIAIINPNDIDESLLNFLKGEFDFEMESNPCGPGVELIVDYCIDNGECTTFDNAEEDEIQAWIDAMNDALNLDFAGLVSDSDPGPYCEYLESEFGRPAFLDAGGAVAEANDIDQWWFETCDLAFPLNPALAEVGPLLDDLGLFAVHCYEPGEFKVVIGDRSENDTVRFNVSCFDDPDVVDILATPGRVESVPAKGSTAHSLIQVFITTEDDGPVPTDTEVQFIAERCAIETEGVNSLEERDEAIENDAGPSGLPFSADEWEEFANEEEPDDKPLYDVYELEDTGDPGVLQIDVDEDDDGLPDRSEALAIFHADLGSEHSGKCAPGPVEITVAVEVEDDPDIVVSFTLTVVGPPAAVAVAADQASVRCGELVRLNAVIKDAAGQDVSDHTLAEVITNYGGVLGGTGAVAGQQGVTTPLSSTVTETFDGVATFYLLTSNQHTGPYEVLVLSGGGGSVADQRLGGLFSTPVQTGRAVVSCAGPAAVAPAAPAAPPSITAPSTGQGIRPPNTGDAGLLD